MESLNVRAKLQRIIAKDFDKFFSSEIVYLSLSNENYRENLDVKIYVGGIDEAGRGPVIGPMVIAAVGFPAYLIAKILRGEYPEIKESKELTPNERLRLANFLLKTGYLKIHLAVIPPAIIDKWVLNGSLNELEALVVVNLSKRFLQECFIIYIDSPSTSESFYDYITKYKDWRGPPYLIAEIKADRLRIPVAIASIFAKIMRDLIIDEIRERLGLNIGSGYPSDPRTRKALSQIIKNYPWIVRKSWKTVRGLK